MKVYRRRHVAAKGHNMEVEEAADNIHNTAEELKQAGKIS